MYFGRLQYKTQPGHHFSVFSQLCHCESLYQGVWSQPRFVNKLNSDLIKLMNLLWDIFISNSTSI